MLNGGSDDDDVERERLTSFDNVNLFCIYAKPKPFLNMDVGCSNARYLHIWDKEWIQCPIIIMKWKLHMPAVFNSHIGDDV